MGEIREHHILKPELFQELITDLFNSRENTNTYQIWGRSGQKQDGIDIISDQKKTVIQCKYKNDFDSKKTKNILKTEIEADVKSAFLSEIEFKHFIFISTYKHDIELQHFAITLRDQNKFPFDISYIGWDEIKKWVLQDSKILAKYFGDNLKPGLVELVSITIDTKNCSWYPIEGLENVFYDRESTKSPFPIFDFTFVNNFSQTIVLKSVRLFVKSLYSGLHGFPAPPIELESINTYTMFFQHGKENILKTIPPIAVGAGHGFRFKLELANEYDGEIYQIENRNILYFSFDFNSDIEIVAPPIYLNTKSDKNTVTIIRLT